MYQQSVNHSIFSNRMLRVLLFLLMGAWLAVGSAGKTAAQSQPQGTQTIWQFWQNYTGADKVTRLLNSYAVGLIGGGCTGTMISPHIMVSAAHCGGPGPGEKIVQFFYMDEDAATVTSQVQAKSENYYARSFPWQVFGNAEGIQDGDFMLWWLDDGSDGLPPGIKYGYLELSTSPVNVGDDGYSFWWNPYTLANGTSFDTLYHSVGEATALGPGSGGPLHFTDFNIAAVPGASGSSVIRADGHTIVGTTALGSGNWRRTGDTSYVLSLHDGDMNAILDAVEYDLLMASEAYDFQLFKFDTPLQRAQWRTALGTNGQITLAKPVLQGVPLGSQPANWVGLVGGARLGPAWYRACWNSPWNQPQQNNPCPPRNGFFLENFEDGQLNTPGVTASAGAVLPPGPNTDSVDLDDGGDDHNGNGGYSFFSANGAAGITFTFNRNALGSWPTRVGIVWTDGDGDTLVEAFDAQGGSLGVIGPQRFADNSHQGTDGEDRFFGFTHQGGISALKVWNTAGGIEVDHLQYETNPLPNNGDSLSHGNARFAPSATYRVTAVVYGLSQNNQNGTIAFDSTRGGPRQTINFQTAYGAWKRVTGRVTLGNQSDYRLILAAPGGSSYYISNIAIVREGNNAALNFQTGDERDSWEYVGGGHPTTWGINGAGDFSGVVSGPSPSRGEGIFTYPALSGDVNGDGRTDLIFVGQGWNGPGLNIRTKIANADGTWTSYSQVMGDGPGVHSNPALTGDVNGDGRTDLIFVGQGWSGPGLNIRVKLSNGDGTWTNRSQVLGDGNAVHTYPALTGDVNGDGRTDIIFVGQGWSGPGLNIRVKLSNGDGTWTNRSQVLGDGNGVHTYPALTGDVNGDDRTDLIFVGQGWSGAGLNIRTKLSNGDGTWSSRSQVLGDGSAVHTYSALTGDVNGDGRTDIIFVGQGWNGSGLNIRTKLSNGDGTWTNRSAVPGDGAGVHTNPALTGDVNGDGRTDIIFVGQGWSGPGLNIRVKLSNGDGTWTNRSQVLGDGNGVHTYPALTGDVNSDDRTDIVFIGENWSGPGLNVRAKLSNGDGNWTAVSRVLGDAILGWNLRQRNVALEANRTYDITFDVKHVSGDLTAVHYMRVENLSAVVAAEQTWQFSQNGQTRTLTLRVSTGDESGNALVFGSNGAATYLVDNIRVQRIN